MREDIYHPQSHHGSQPQARTHVIGKNQKRAAIWHNASVQRHPVHHRAHRMFAHAIIKVTRAEIRRGNGTLAGH